MLPDALPSFQAQARTLYVVATPIGNLSDISARALAILSTCDKIACEDTRVVLKLLNHLNIRKPLVSYRDENESSQALKLVEELKNGLSLALVSDAGTPTISDPGFRLVRLCRKEGIAVSPIPGPCAFIAALSASGLPSNAFFFAGFLPPKSAARVRFFEANRLAEHTLIVYESCHRILSFLEELTLVMGEERVIAVCREISKKFETFIVGPAGQVAAELKTRSHKGEFVVIVAPAAFQL